MKFNPLKPHRRSIRLKGHDYTAPGAYFVTICTHQRAELFGDVVEGEMRLNEYGQIVADEWERSAIVRAEIQLDEWVVMPNHVHGIIVINDPGVEATRHVGATRRVAPTDAQSRNGPAPNSIGAIMAQFKSIATKRINEIRATPSAPVWQRNYYEHVIRNDRELTAIRRYIQNNPLQWPLDRDNAGNAHRLSPPATTHDYMTDLSQ